MARLETRFKPEIPVHEVRPCVPGEPPRCLVRHLQPLSVLPAPVAISLGVNSRKLGTRLHGCGQTVNHNPGHDCCEMFHEVLRLLGRLRGFPEELKRGYNLVSLPSASIGLNLVPQDAAEGARLPCLSPFHPPMRPPTLRCGAVVKVGII